METDTHICPSLLRETGGESGYSSKAFAVFGLPLILLAVHLVCVVATNIDPKSKGD